MRITSGGEFFGERATGLEPATSSLGSWHSTTELRPQVRLKVKKPAGTVKHDHRLPAASRKLRRSGSLTAGSPGDTLLSFPCFIHCSSSPTSSKRWSKEFTMKSSGW